MLGLFAKNVRRRIYNRRDAFYNSVKQSCHLDIWVLGTCSLCDSVRLSTNEHFNVKTWDASFEVIEEDNWL